MTERPPLAPVEQAIYEFFKDACVAGQPCPSNLDAANKFFRDTSTISSHLNQLVAKGWLTTQSCGRGRIMTDMVSGCSTAISRQKPAMIFAHSIRHEDTRISGDALQARVEADQARLRAMREAHLIAEQQRYGLPKRGRLVEDMVA